MYAKVHPAFQPVFEQIREMIKLTDGDKFETSRSLVQDLTFNAAAEEFTHCNVEFGESQMRTLGIIGVDGLYTNIGLLLADQCTHTVKFAVFNGTKKGEFKTRKEIDGSILIGVTQNCTSVNNNSMIISTS